MKKTAIVTGVSMLAVAGFVVAQQQGVRLTSLKGDLDVSALSSTSSSVNQQQLFCEETCGQSGLCCDQLIGGGFPTCKKCETCNVVDDLNASFCCSDKGRSNNSESCCAYNPNFCMSSSSSNSSTSSSKPNTNVVTCNSKTNTKPAWGVSDAHTYTDNEGPQGRTDAFKKAGEDALVKAQNACTAITVAVCDRDCSTVPPVVTSFTQNNSKCEEKLLQLGLHSVTCRVDGVCTGTRKCSPNLKS